MGYTRFIIDNYSVDRWAEYILLALSLSLGIRVFLAFLRAVELSAKQKPHGFLSYFWLSFRGYGAEPYKADYWAPYFLGVLELFVYPFLMQAGLWIGVGLWISLKTLANWKAWTDNRPVFNRFLIGNALTVILAFLVLARHVSIQLKIM